MCRLYHPISWFDMIEIVEAGQHLVLADPCDGVTCGDNGACENGACVCNDLWSGTNCEVPPPT